MLDFIPDGSVTQRIAQRIFPIACCVIGLGVAIAAAEQGPANRPEITRAADTSTDDYISIPLRSNRFALASDPALSLAAATSEHLPEPAALLNAELIFNLPAKPARKAATAASRGPHVHIVRMLVTAYCPCVICCGPTARGITASGKTVSYHHGLFAAADLRRLPFGSKVSIPGYAYGTPVEVIDTGTALVGNHLDVFFPTHEQALAWGRRWLNVTIAERARG